MSSLSKFTYTIKVIVNPDFTVVIIQVILHEIVLHVYAHIFLHALTIFFLELVGELQQNDSEDRVYAANQLGKYRLNTYARNVDAVARNMYIVGLNKRVKMVYKVRTSG